MREFVFTDRLRNTQRECTVVWSAFPLELRIYLGYFQTFTSKNRIFRSHKVPLLKSQRWCYPLLTCVAWLHGWASCIFLWRFFFVALATSWKGESTNWFPGLLFLISTPLLWRAAFATFSLPLWRDRHANNKLAALALFQLTVEKNASSQCPPPVPPTPPLGRETERQPLFCSVCPLHTARAESNAERVDRKREKKKKKKGRAKERSEGEWREWLGGKRVSTAQLKLQCAFGQKKKNGRRGGV